MDIPGDSFGSHAYYLGCGVRSIFYFTRLDFSRSCLDTNTSRVRRIAYTPAKDPSKVHLITANYTGSLRLFVGLGWPMVYFVALFLSKNTKDKKRPWVIELEDEHSIPILSLLPALLYFLVIYFKGTLSIFDGIVLSVIYLPLSFVKNAAV